MNDLNRKILWCILLNFSKDDLEKTVCISKLVSEADECLVNQVKCDIERCVCENENKRIRLKELILSVFTSNKLSFSYIQGMHDIGSVFITLFQRTMNEGILNIEIIMNELDKVGMVYDTCELKEIIFILEERLKSANGELDICFLAFEKFLFKYSIPFIYKNNGKNATLDHILTIIGEDLLYLLNISSPDLFKLFETTRKNNSDSRVFMFILSWIITWFSHNISIEKIDTLSYLFGNFIANEPVYIIFLIENIIIQNADKLIKFITSQIGSDNMTDLCSNDDIYPFIHLYFQNLNFNEIEWVSIVERSNMSFNKLKDVFFRSRALWNINSKSSYTECSILYILMNNYKQAIYLFFILSGVVLAYLFVYW